ncbi:hypothetical protein N7532_009266 [Penicillium argentinense]|uniref:DUF7137 domain-containing protein n=1 Tax=Penicillium argentinense TaxID=1131581 RepID=A0A9W9EZ15_9EURO|nr:uncharacterized protein N7532_009266 [Penicillium argentinense]KAJ5090582.1 hypothetical protein N7532_009266 [Penicillium argentinense]
MRFFIFSVLCSFLLLGTLTSAWPWGPDKLVARDAVYERADKTAESTATETAASTSASETETATNTKSSKDETTTGTNTETSTDTKTKSKSDKSNTKTTATSSISIDPAAGAGGISMITLRLIIHNILQNRLNSATYTLTSNMSVHETGKVVWDTNATQTIPLLTATYTLFVVDSEKELGDTAKAGYLSSQIGYSFGMYSPLPYTPLNEFKCATCNGALSDVQRQGLKFAIGMAAITIASFTWFVGGLGIFAT